MTCDAFSTSIRTSSTLPSGTYSTRSSLRASSLPSAELPGPSVFANVLATNNSPKAGVSSLIATVMSTSAGDIRVNGVAPASIVPTYWAARPAWVPQLGSVLIGESGV